MLRPDVPTMGDIFNAGGYRTGIFGKWHLGDSYPYLPQYRGFQEAVHHKSWGITPAFAGASLSPQKRGAADYWGNDYFDDTYYHNGKPEKYQGYCNDVWFRLAMEWIVACAAKKEPFFCYLPTNVPHGPHFVAEGYAAPYRKAGLPAAFFGMIANLDENVGKLLAMLDQTGLADNTILIFMTDNGGTPGTKVFNVGMRGAKTSLYDGGHRVPCFVRWPGGGLREPADIGDLTTCQDLLPTLIDMSGLKAPPDARFDGVSRNISLRISWLFSQTSMPYYTKSGVVAPSGRRAHQDKPDPSTALGVTSLGVIKRDVNSTVIPRLGSGQAWRKWRLVKGEELYPRFRGGQACPCEGTRLAGNQSRGWRRSGPEGERCRAASRRRQGDAGALRALVDAGRADRERALLRSHRRRQREPHDSDLRRLVYDLRRQLRTPARREQLALEYPGRVPAFARTGLPPRRRGWAIRVHSEPLAGGGGHRSGCALERAVRPGKALLIAKARLKINQFDESKSVASNDKSATFAVCLKAGKARLQTWFYPLLSQGQACPRAGGGRTMNCVVPITRGSVVNRCNWRKGHD
jgi:hypothetical protein